jgi:hypothetical protein
MTRLVVASNVGSGVASRRLVSRVSPAHRLYTPVEGQRQAPKGRQSRVCAAVIPKAGRSTSPLRLTTARLRQLAVELSDRYTAPLTHLARARVLTGHQLDGAPPRVLRTAPTSKRYAVISDLITGLPPPAAKPFAVCPTRRRPFATSSRHLLSSKKGKRRTCPPLNRDSAASCKTAHLPLSPYQ